MKCYFVGLILLTGFLLWPRGSYGQDMTTATVRGTVLDKDGRTVPEAEVIAIHEPTGLKSMVVTNQNGQFSLQNTRSGGSYTVKVSRMGYQSERKTGIQLDSGKSQTLSIELRKASMVRDVTEGVTGRGFVQSPQFGGQQVVKPPCSFCAPTSVHSADLDGDGDKDVIASSYGTSLFTRNGEVVWYENEGEGNFEYKKVISKEGQGFDDVNTADVDSDGDRDVLATYLFGKIIWYKNNGNGIFISSQVIATNASESDDLNILTIDADNDEDIDIISSSDCPEEVAWYENDGTGSFGEEQIIAENEECIANRKAHHTADMDSDGDTDILSSSLSNDQLVWYENDGNGEFGSSHIISSDQGYLGQASAGDLDGDNDPDVVSASNIAWYENDGTGDFGAAQSIPGDISGFSGDVNTNDMDGDGAADVILVSPYDGKIAWYENNGNGDFQSPQIIASSVAGLWSISTTDLDEDSDFDVMSHASDNTVSWYENNSSGVFGLENVITKSVSPGPLHKSDLDKDGNLDIISGNSNSITWYRNDGLEEFSLYEEISSEVMSVSSVYPSDLDGDSDVDVLSSSFSDNKVAWYVNDGDGNLSSQRTITASIDRRLC